MLFSSITFLYYFLPAVLIIYFLIPAGLFKNAALLLASLVFYAWGEPKYVFLMIGMILVDYLLGIMIERGGRMWLITALALNVGVLCFFKFSDAAWPIGISFYIFQLISYLADVYRGTVKAQRNLINLGAYVAMFPQLIAGPIVRYADIEKQLTRREHTWENFACGFQRFVCGLAKKILISNALGELCAVFQASQDPSVLFYWLYAVSFALQIYFDFSGYSDMAIGLGRIFGFSFPENFNYPYISGSITEFWRRWHMSLGTWFRDYVYIPLGGNRVPRWRWYLNILIVWSLTGLWHGAAANFLIWGLLFAALLVLEKNWLLKKLEKARVWNHVYVLFWVVISFVIFNTADLQEALSYLAAMFGAGEIPFVSAEFLYYLRSYGVLLIAAVIGATPVVGMLKRKFEGLVAGRFAGRCVGEPAYIQTPAYVPLRALAGIQAAAAVAALLVCTAYLIDSSFNPFLYFRF